MVARVVCNKEGNGDGCKSNGDEGGRGATAMMAMVTATAMMWAMAMVRLMVVNKKGNGEGGKGNGIGNEGGMQQREQWLWQQE